MKTSLLLTLTLFFLWSGYSQEQDSIKNHATSRYVFNDAVGLSEASKAYKQNELFANDPTRNAAAKKSSNAIAKKKAIDEIADAKVIIEQKKLSVATILSHYFKDVEEVKSFNKKYGFDLPEDIQPADRAGIWESLNLKVKESQGSNGITSTATIDAIATFLANRFKKEINVAFLNKFRKHLDSIPQLASFFPLSKKILTDSDPYNYPVFIGTLRQACEQDLANLKNDLPQILASMDTGNEKHTLIMNALASFINVKSFSTFRTAVNTIAQDPDLKKKFPDLHLQMELLAFCLNASTQQAENDCKFLDNVNLSQFEDTEFRRFYFALLVRQNEGYLNDAKIIDTWINANQAEAVEKLAGFLNAFREFNNEIDALSDAVTNGESEQITISLVQILKTLDKSLITAQQERWFTTAVNFEQARALTKYAVALNQAIVYVGGKKYGLALSEITGFIVLAADSKLTPGQKTMIKKYSGFMADMLHAESKDDLIEALDNSANPVGSYRIKRNSTFNVSLNGYAGGFYGTDLKGTTLYGFTAPVGIYAGWGNMCKDKPILANDNGKSFGLFLPLIDVGAVASFRLKDSETELADISWDNVFAPGAYLTYGFGKCPVSLNIGGQMGPALRSIGQDGKSILGEKEWFWRASIVIDIPLIDFYTKQKEYKIHKSNPPVPESKPLFLGDDKAILINRECSQPTIQQTDHDDIAKLFLRFKNSTVFDWGDENNCEDRANAICTILTKHGYPNGKAWLFRENPDAPGENNSFRLRWAFHVAPYMVDKGGKTIILDPALFGSAPGDLQQWANRVVLEGKAYYMLSTNSYYMHKKNKKFCGDDTFWETDAIEDAKSKTIDGLARGKWLLNRDKKTKAAYTAYRKLLDEDKLIN